MSDLVSPKLIIDICRGYSESTYWDNTTIFIKHFDLEDHYYIDKVRNEKLEEAVKKGLVKEKEKFEEIKKLGIWTKKDQDELDEGRVMVENLTRTRSKLFISSQIKETDDQIKEWESKWKAKKIYKANLLGLTAEFFADKTSSNFAIIRGLFKDRELNRPFIGFLDDPDADEFNKAEELFFKGLEHINSTSIKKAALSTQFQNLYSISQNPVEFLGRNIYKFTSYQTSLLSYGSFFRTVLGELGDMVTDELKEDPEKLERMYISNRNKQVERAKRGANTEFFGDDSAKATLKDYKEAEMLQKGFNSIEAANELG